jgi:hypothetical protein
MKASTSNPGKEGRQPVTRERETSNSKDEIDQALLEESLQKSVWERMLANDDALRLADTLRTAMTKTGAKS